jgi:hypothetical protein
LPAALASALTVFSFSSAHSCGLEPTLKGGFSVSHPGALQVAVAVANARRDGVLPMASQDAVSNDVRRRQILADLRRLHDRLNSGWDALAADVAPFSLVLVGPGLWSHFHPTRGGVLSRFHAQGPLPDRVVVLTHHAALQALLLGDLSVEQAAARGLIAFSGNDAAMVQGALEISLSAST